VSSALLAFALLLAADAPAVQKVRITVRAIAASNDGAQAPGMAPKLAPIADHLQGFGEQFRFRSYTLLDEQSFDLAWKAPEQMEMVGRVRWRRCLDRWCGDCWL